MLRNILEDRSSHLPIYWLEVCRLSFLVICDIGTDIIQYKNSR